MNKSLAARIPILLFCVAALAITITAQKRDSLVIGVDIEQCANGPLSAPIPCNTSSGNDGYTRGNVNESKSHYFEGQFVPIRLVVTGLTPGQVYSVTLGYDYTKSGKYATDYLGSYDFTESMNNNPCVGVTGCDLIDEQEVSVPLDPQVALGFNGIDDGPVGPTGGDDITQIPGFFSLFGATIDGLNGTGISGYTLSGSTAGDSSKSFTITFRADEANVVIAYGAHISARSDWGLLNSAVNITGSPYHNFVVDFPGANSGSRDLQLSASAVIFPAFIIIEKTVLTFDLQTTSTLLFPFTSSAAIWGGGMGSTSFSLADQVNEPFNPVGPLSDREGTNTSSLGVTSFGSGNLITVTEGLVNPALNWSLVGITCTSVNGTNNNTINNGARQVSIQLEEGETVECEFHNSQLAPSAAHGSISGRILDSFGNGIGGVYVNVANAQTGDTYTSLSNSFGYYTVEGLEVGNFYVITVGHKRYEFTDNTRTLTLDGDFHGLDFIANPRE